MFHENPGDEPWENEDTHVEIIELLPGEVLCAFVLEGIRDEDEAAVTAYWRDTICPDAAGRMAKFLSNHFEPRGD